MMEIQEIKEKLSITEVLSHYGLQPDKNRMLHCPFHEDKTPSMQVYPETNTVFCFSGNCEHTGKAIDQIDFILHKEQCTKHEAIVKAKALTGVPTTSQKPQPMNEISQLFERLQKAMPSDRSKPAQYLKSRGLHNTIEIGWSSGASFKSLRNCIIFPLKDSKGRIVSLYGRSITASDKNKHYYLKDRKGLYPNYLDPETTGTVILTESIIDSATIAKYTPYHTLALYGTNGLTAEHETTLKSCKHLQEVILFFDGDKAGNTAAEKYSKHLHELLPKVIISKVGTPDGEDPNSLVQGHEPEILGHLIDNREQLFLLHERQSEPEAVLQQTPASKPDTANPAYATLRTDNPEYLVFIKPPVQVSVMGGIALHPIDKLKVTLKLERTDSQNPLHSLRHSVDLYHDDQAEKLIRKAAERLELGTREVQLIMAELTAALENYRLEVIEKQKPKKAEKRTIPSEREKKAISFMQRKGYLKQLNQLIGQAGVVGEENNRLILWITYATRKRPNPLHVICLGASGTGKTYLQEKVSDLVPEEDKVSGTAISENALYYAQSLNLSHKLFIIEDLDGAGNILYALRELQTKHEITKMVTQKDSKGNLKTEIMTVKGPISLTATTTKERLYEDNANRCLLIYLDGSKQQQEAIMDDQRKRSAGKINKRQQQETREFLRDIQTLYKPITVVNPYAEQLKIPETVFKPLRTNSHYLAFIEGITFCNQYQREVKTDPETGELYITTTLEDIELANELLKDVLLSKSDELTKACRSFFELLKGWLQREKKQSFYSKELRQAYRMAPTTVNRHLYDLMRYGYVKVTGGSKAKGYEYEPDNQEEYNHLKNSIENALDVALGRIRNQNR